MFTLLQQYCYLQIPTSLNVIKFLTVLGLF